MFSPGLPDDSPRRVDAYLAAVRLDPANADIHNDFGVLLSERRAVARSRRRPSLKRGAPIETDFAEAHFCLGVVLLKTGHHQKDAVEHLRKA